MHTSIKLGILLAAPTSWGAAEYTGYHLHHANNQERDRLIQKK